MKKKAPQEYFNAKDFERRLKERLYQLKRSKLYARKIRQELSGAYTIEAAREYIKNAGNLSVAEIKKRNLNAIKRKSGRGE